MPKKILLADDSITIQKVVELTFSDGDYEIIATNNGSKAIQKLSEFRPDIILSDIIMPEKNGYELCEFVKSHPDYRTIPVILLTGTFEPFDPDRAEKAGCDAVVTKPFESQSLVSKVEELIRTSSSQPGRAPGSGSGDQQSAAQPGQTMPWQIPSFGGFDESTDKSDLDSAPPEESPFAGSWSAEESSPIDMGTEQPGAETTQSGQEPRPPRSFQLDTEESPIEASTDDVATQRPSSDEGPWAAESDPNAAEASEGRTLRFPRLADDWQTPQPPVTGDEPPASGMESSRTFESDEPQLEGEPLAVSPDLGGAPPASEEPSDPWASEETGGAPLDWQPLGETGEEAPTRAQDPSTAETTMWPTPPVEPTAPFDAEEEAGAEEPAWAGAAPPEEPSSTLDDRNDQDLWSSAVQEEEMVSTGGAADEGTASTAGLSDADVERIARRVVELMSDTAVRNIAWEVIPEMAEMIVRERIRQLERE